MKVVKGLWILLLVVALVGCRAGALPGTPTGNSPVVTPASISPVQTPFAASPVATPSAVSSPPPLTSTITSVVGAGNTVYLPLVAVPVATPTPLPTPIPPATPTALPPPVPKPSFGVQVDPNTNDLSRVFRWVQGMGFGWIKVQVEWMVIEEQPGSYRWVELDRLVQLSNDFGFKLLLSVVDAPGWLRAEVGYNGPPHDPAEFGRFMGVLASHYAGKVTAYELWNEPNLQREWYGETLDPAAFVALTAAGSQAVRQADPQALILSAGLGVTGIDDGVSAIDDRRFLRESLQAGLAQWVDGIGVHPYGYANPPWERAADATHTRSAWNNHPSFFFLDTLEDYHAILVAAGVDAQLWPTEFGWPSIDGIRAADLAADHPYPYAMWLTEQEQADYLTTAARLMIERPWVGPFFVWNLNMSVTWGPDRPESLFSLIRPDTAFRPAYIALRVFQP
ncbi:MAG TPA: cellulase family glycosylhydrolase [Anaerolineae bacterium]|nr:cellulase family glycosylhydrolase [Anaerolineae bacterium]HQH38867.1 cellulase family glycosylhydrolase [Anaerolineae bacterium]